MKNKELIEKLMKLDPEAEVDPNASRTEVHGFFVKEDDRHNEPTIWVYRDQAHAQEHQNWSDLRFR
jgi:hypothetical protein